MDAILEEAVQAVSKEIDRNIVIKMTGTWNSMPNQDAHFILLNKYKLYDIETRKKVLEELRKFEFEELKEVFLKK